MLRQHSSCPVILSCLLVVYPICSYWKQKEIRRERGGANPVCIIITCAKVKKTLQPYFSFVWARQESFPSAKVMKVWTFIRFKKNSPHNDFLSLHKQKEVLLQVRVPKFGAKIGHFMFSQRYTFPADFATGSHTEEMEKCHAVSNRWRFQGWPRFLSAASSQRETQSFFMVQLKHPSLNLQSSRASLPGVKM